MPLLTIKLLGTSAGELYPGLWCQCRNCTDARAHGGPNLRASTCAVVNNLCLIDFPPEIATQARTHGVDLCSIEHILVTHSHGDHFFPYLLRWRARPPAFHSDPPPTASAPRFTPLPTLHLYGNRRVLELASAELWGDPRDSDLELHEAIACQPFAAGDLEVHPVAANHDVGRENALHYVVRRGGRTMLYALDGALFLPGTYEYLRQFRLDLVLIEATYGLFSGGANHMSFETVRLAANTLRADGLMAPGGRIVATHFSPHHCPPHERSRQILAQYGVETACDGAAYEL